MMKTLYRKWYKAGLFSAAGLFAIGHTLLAMPVFAQQGYEIQVGILPSLRAGSTPSFQDYVLAIWRLILGIIVIAALLGLVIGGVLYITAGVSSAAKSEAKARIQSATVGVIMIFLALLLLDQFFGDFGNITIPTPKLPEGGGLPGELPPECSDPQELARQYKEPWPPRNSPELNSLILCIRNSPLLAGKNLGDVFTIDLENNGDRTHLCNATRGNPVCSSFCSHRRESCHYGGATGETGARAVDFSNITIGGLIIRAAQACGSGAARCEDNAGNNRGVSGNGITCNPGSTHVHINTHNCDER